MSKSQKHLHAVDLEDTDITHLADARTCSRSAKGASTLCTRLIATLPGREEFASEQAIGAE